MKLLGIGLAGCSFSMWPVLIIAIYNNDNDQFLHYVYQLGTYMHLVASAYSPCYSE